MSIIKKHLDNLPNTLLELKAKKIMALQESVHVNLYPGEMGVDVEGELDGSEDIIEVPLSDLVLNEPAEKMLKADSKANVKSLVKAIQSGQEMDPLLVMQDGDKYKILDGHHRFFANKLAGKDTVKVFVVPGDEITDVDQEGNPL